MESIKKFKDNDDPGTGSDDEFRSGHSRPGGSQDGSVKEHRHQQQDPDDEQGHHQDLDGHLKPHQHHG